MFVVLLLVAVVPVLMVAVTVMIDRVGWDGDSDWLYV